MKTETRKPTYINGVAPAVRVMPIRSHLAITSERPLQPRRPLLARRSGRPAANPPADAEPPAPESQTELAPAPVAPTKAPVRPPKPPVAPARPKPAPAAKRPQPATRGRAKATARGGTKKSKVLALLQRPKGATLHELQQATGWQAHTVRGFLSGTITKKMRLKVKSAKRADGARVYSVRK